MGAKSSKGLPQTKATPEPRKVYLSEKEVIDTRDPTIFPEKVRNEFSFILGQLSDTIPFHPVLFDGNSELIKWLKQCKSSFDYQNSNDESSNNNNNNEERKERKERNRQSLAMLRAALRGSFTESTPQPTGPPPPLPWEEGYQKGGEPSVERDKSKFAAKLSSMCSSTNIRYQFIDNQLETTNLFILVFTYNGYIVGFSTLGVENECLHNYLICSGPRNLGIGKLIIQLIHGYAKDKGYECVSLNAAGSKGFHEKMGYKIKAGNEGKNMPKMIFQLQGGKTRKRKTRKHNK